MLETKILVVMFRTCMPGNEQLSVVKTSVVEKVFTDKEIQETRSPAVEWGHPKECY